MDFRILTFFITLKKCFLSIAIFQLFKRYNSKTTRDTTLKGLNFDILQTKFFKKRTQQARKKRAFKRRTKRAHFRTLSNLAHTNKGKFALTRGACGGFVFAFTHHACRLQLGANSRFYPHHATFKHAFMRSNRPLSLQGQKPNLERICRHFKQLCLACKCSLAFTNLSSWR